VHTSEELTAASFAITVDGRAADLDAVLPGFTERDRVGVVVRRPLGGAGASLLVLAAVTGFYEEQRRRGEPFFIYPDYFVFHAGRALGDHRKLDIWPSHKEVVVADEPEALLRAINDRAITRLVVEDGEPRDAELGAEELASARARITSCLAYSASGRVTGADVRVAANSVVEGYVDTTLDPEQRAAELRARGADARADEIAAHGDEIPPEQRDRIKRKREALLEGGVPVETYRRIELHEALARLV
jgi:hypothetical protein